MPRRKIRKTSADDEVNLTEEPPTCLNGRAHFDELLESKSENEDNSEFLMVKILDIRLHPEVVLVVPICSESKQYKCF